MRLTLYFGTIVLAAVGVSSDSQSSLNELLDERIQFNEQYTKANLKGSAESPYVKQITKYETAASGAWNDLLEYAKKSDDDDLKKSFLRLEYNNQLLKHIRDLEYLETDEEHATAREGLKTFQKKLDAIK